MDRETDYKPVSLKALGIASSKVPCKNLAMTSLDTQKCPCSAFPPSPVPWGEEPLLTLLNIKDPWRHAAHLKFIKCKRHSFQELPCQNWMSQILTRLGLGSKSGLLQMQKPHQAFPHQNFCIWTLCWALNSWCFQMYHAPWFCFRRTLPLIPLFTKNSWYGATSVPKNA